MTNNSASLMPAERQLLWSLSEKAWHGALEWKAVVKEEQNWSFC